MIKAIPASPEAIFIFAHGAGAGMDHPFMKMFAERLQKYNIGTIRFNFPYMEKGRKAPGSQKEAVESISMIYSKIYEAYKIPLFTGGKSYGGRMASIAASLDLLPKQKGLIFLGFPLHAPGKPSTKRAEHLKKIKIPMLFLQGQKDKLAEIDLLKKVTSEIPAAELIEYPYADHSFKVPKKSNVDQEELYDKIAHDIASWISKNKQTGSLN